MRVAVPREDGLDDSYSGHTGDIAERGVVAGSSDLEPFACVGRGSKPSAPGCPDDEGSNAPCRPPVPAGTIRAANLPNADIAATDSRKHPICAPARSSRGAR